MEQQPSSLPRGTEQISTATIPNVIQTRMFVFARLNATSGLLSDGTVRLLGTACFGGGWCLQQAPRVLVGDRIGSGGKELGFLQF